MRIVRVLDTRAAYARACAEKSGFPSRKLKVFATTGTSGKTSTTYFIYHILKVVSLKPGMLSTIENRVGVLNQISELTTPGPREIQELLKKMLESGCESVAMEASSHAIDQSRIRGIDFDSLVFLNLTPEHLDYHVDLESYFKAKSELFRSYREESKKKVSVAICIENEFGKRLLSDLRKMKVKPLPLFGEGADARALPGENFVQGQNEVLGLWGSRFDIRMGQKEGVFDTRSIETHQVGRFNIQNILAAVAATHPHVQDWGLYREAISQLTMIPGRLERVFNSSSRNIFVDYAHKPDALEKVLTTIKEIEPKQKRITVFGCGGDRDRLKRPLMGEIASRLSDEVWVTNDNPRSENPQTIIDEILKGISPQLRNKVKVEPDRRLAIEQAIAASPPKSVVLIAGKGHEAYQIVAGSKSLFSDVKVAYDAALRLDSQN